MIKKILLALLIVVSGDRRLLRFLAGSYRAVRLASTARSGLYGQIHSATSD